MNNNIKKALYKILDNNQLLLTVYCVLVIIIFFIYFIKEKIVQHFL